MSLVRYVGSKEHTYNILHIMFNTTTVILALEDIKSKVKPTKN